MKQIAFIGLVLLLCNVCQADMIIDLDRTGTVYVSPKLGLAIPLGALADEDYTSPAASWRKEGVALTIDFGYYVSTSSIVGVTASYSSFTAKQLSTLPTAGGTDNSRMRIRFGGVFYQYMLIPTGKYRPFAKLGVGMFDANRWLTPVPGSNPTEYRDYSMGGKPAFSFGIGFTGEVSPRLSASLSAEAMYLNSTSSSWTTSGASIGPLNQNMLFLPVYLSVIYHLSNH
jgi:hypothetical protein